eukprot:3401854-Pleurochrysis_carterae.AAC.1
MRLASIVASVSILVGEIAGSAARRGALRRDSEQIRRGAHVEAKPVFCRRPQEASSAVAHERERGQCCLEPHDDA